MNLALRWVKETNSIEVCCMDCSTPPHEHKVEWVGDLKDGHWKCYKCNSSSDDHLSAKSGY